VPCPLVVHCLADFIPPNFQFNSYIRVRAAVLECGEGQSDRHSDGRDIYISPRLRFTRTAKFISLYVHFVLSRLSFRQIPFKNIVVVSSNCLMLRSCFQLCILIMAALCNRGAIIFLPCSFFLLSSFYLLLFFLA